MTELDLTEHEYPTSSFRVNAAVFLLLSVTFVIGVVLSVCKLAGWLDWPVMLATAGLWLPAVGIGIAALIRRITKRP